MQAWVYARGTYVSRTTKESAFKSPFYQLIQQLVATTILHREECDKVPSGDIFQTRCLTQTEVFLHLPFALALYLSCMALGSMPSIRICRGHWVTRLALSYEFDTSEMVHIPIRYMSTTVLWKMWVLVRGVGQQWRIPDDNIMDLI